MASRKEQKQQARQRRLVQEQARAERERRNRRLRTLGGVAAGVMIFVVVVIAIGSSGPSGLQTGSKQKATEKLIDAELAGIPQSGAQLGNPKVPVTVVYYGDLECSVCAAFTTGQDGGALPQPISHQVKDGQVKIQYRSFCTATCSDAGQSVFDAQQVAALSAGRQHKFWYYTELFHQEQGAEGSGYVTQTSLNEASAQVRPPWTGLHRQDDTVALRSRFARATLFSAREEATERNPALRLPQVSVARRAGEAAAHSMRDHAGDHAAADAALKASSRVALQSPNIRGAVPRRRRSRLKPQLVRGSREPS